MIFHYFYCSILVLSSCQCTKTQASQCLNDLSVKLLPLLKIYSSLPRITISKKSNISNNRWLKKPNDNSVLQNNSNSCIANMSNTTKKSHQLFINYILKPPYSQRHNLQQILIQFKTRHGIEKFPHFYHLSSKKMLVISSNAAAIVQLQAIIWENKYSGETK